MKKLFWVSIFLTFFSCNTTKQDTDLVAEYFNIGNAFYELGDYSKAEEYYLKSIELNDEFYKARYNLVYIYVKKQQFSEAAKQIKLLEDVDEDNLLIRSMKAYINYSEGKLDDALELYKDIYNSGLKNSDILLAIVKINYQLGKYSEGLDYTDELLEIISDENTFYLCALLAEGANEDDLALSYSDAVLAINPDNLTVLKKKLELYKKSDDSKKIENVLVTLIDKVDEAEKRVYYFDLSILYLLEENNFSKGFEYLNLSLKAGFNDKDRINQLLETPDLIEYNKIRQLFIDNNLVDSTSESL